MDAFGSAAGWDMLAVEEKYVPKQPKVNRHLPALIQQPCPVARQGPTHDALGDHAV